MIEALNILEGFDEAQPAFNSAEYIHRVVEALKLAYRGSRHLLRRSQVHASIRGPRFCSPRNMEPSAAS